jgi:hypothetical protein
MSTVTPIARRPRQFTLLKFGEDNRAQLAADDLARAGETLASIAMRVHPCDHRTALGWIDDWRLYVLERNPRRFQDDAFHLLDRGYQPWRSHRISFTSGDLTVIGIQAWCRSLREEFRQDVLPLQSDNFSVFPGRRLRRYAELVRGLSEALDARSERKL